jgi:hypothetical protein
MIDHVEQGREKPPEPALVEDTDLKQYQGKPPVHLTLSLSLSIIFLSSYAS